MRDPREGVRADGTITTGADRMRVPATFEPVIAEVVDAVTSRFGADVSLSLYGSVATGQARPGASDVDLLAVGVGAAAADRLASELSARYVDVCRSVEIAVARPGDFVGDGDEAYGGRVFLRHYCVRLTGPDQDMSTADFPADRRAARGFNGDVADHAIRWRAALDAGAAPAEIGRRLARKTLLAVAGLVSVHDLTWTTDRGHAARRWPQLAPIADLDPLARWADGAASPDGDEVRRALDEIVAPVVVAFADTIGLWRDRSA